MRNRVNKSEGAGADSDQGLGPIEHSICQARSGSFSALGQLFDHYRGYLLRVANEELQSGLAPKIAPSDLVQETFLQAARAFPKFTGKSENELRAWLRQILMNNLLDTADRFAGTQKRDISRECSLDEKEHGPRLVDQFAGLPASPSAALQRSEDHLRVQRALDQLSKVEQQVIQMRSFDELPFEQIGATIGRSAEAARKVWSRAIEKLAQQLG